MRYRLLACACAQRLDGKAGETKAEEGAALSAASDSTWSPRRRVVGREALGRQGAFPSASHREASESASR